MTAGRLLRFSTGTLCSALALSSSVGCTDETPLPEPEEPKLAEGIFAPMGQVLPSATDEQKATFERGRDVARHRFTPEDGLGPRFNVSFCGACHEKPDFGGAAGHYRNFLLVRQELSDGSQSTTGVNGVQVQFSNEGIPFVPTEDETNLFAQRNPIPFFGLGLLAELPEDEILKRVDPDDEDGDGISGRPNYDRGFVGRFGMKAQTVSIEGFIRGPLFNHLGITTNPLSNELKNALPVPSGLDEGEMGANALSHGFGTAQQAQAAAPDEPNMDDDGVPDPEMSEQDLFDIVSFSMLLAAPEPAEPTEQTLRGEKLFADVGCAACHAPALNGPRGLIPVYSDLLLHDMGEELADGIRMGDADGFEYRTQPLWGLSAVGPYLHDGRAQTITEAIELHGGEANASRDAFTSLSDAERDDVLAFLVSLGGEDQASTGLVPPDADVPPVGSYGGPEFELSASDRERFIRGREAFDHERGLAGGIGPVFNGDSCRACHFDPIIGGAGPVDLNVVRHGHVEDQTFTPPDIGTILHRHSSTDMRPPLDPMANVFELRQTPSILGLGLIDRIAEETIEAAADPDDLDMDGISGRAHVLADGRLGRLGWKADVPNLAEFARDGMSAELGVTVPDQPGLTFGRGTDNDPVPDPEISAAELDDLVFFMATLAAPPRTSSDAALEQQGEALFAQAGCDGCHTPSLPTVDGEMVPLYSDLLLHDVAPAGFVGIVSGDASMREFRTPPLWGLATSAPYMHNGDAYNVEAAIALHEGEAEASRTSFESMDAVDRAALIAFLESL